MATTFVCPKGDQSDDPEFCSVCGVKMEGASATSGATPATAERCPQCGMERKADARFCETCRYDFRIGAAGAVASPVMADPVEAAPPAPQPTPATPQPAPVATTAIRLWEAVVAVDPTLDVEPDPDAPCPTDAPERTFPLDLPENLIGRRSANRGIFPQIALNDPGVSHRHLVVYRNADASLVISDLGSTNGTFLNGSTDRLESGVKTPVSDGDRIELGRWTRITFCQHT